MIFNAILLSDTVIAYASMYGRGCIDFLLKRGDTGAPALHWRQGIPYLAHTLQTPLRQGLDLYHKTPGQGIKAYSKRMVLPPRFDTGQSACA